MITNNDFYQKYLRKYDVEDKDDDLSHSDGSYSTEAFERISHPEKVDAREEKKKELEEDRREYYYAHFWDDEEDNSYNSYRSSYDDDSDNYFKRMCEEEEDYKRLHGDDNYYDF